jgi:hypothetical protein
MKKKANLRSKSVLNYLVILFISIIAVSCTKNDNSDVSIPVTFNLNFVYYDLNGEYIYAYFATSGTEIPEVKINGATIGHFTSSGSLITGYLYIPFDNEVEYSVTANGQTTSGTIDMPEFITQMECNNVTIYESISNYNFTKSTKYKLVWDQADCDHQFIICGYVLPNVYEFLEPDNSKYTINASDLKYPGSSYLYIYLDLVNGDRMISGSKPGVNGDYGDGFVTAIADCSFYLTSSSSYNYTDKSIVLPQKREINIEEQNAKYLERFKKVCFGK